MTEECFLKQCMNCSDVSGGGFCSVGVNRLRNASEIRGDGLHEQLSHDLNLKYVCHKNCVSSYTSKFHIKRYLSQHDKANIESTAKRTCRSQVSLFNFKEHCIICGEACEEKDPRNPKRWRRVVKCRTADRGDNKTFKDVILDTCDERNDDWGNKVRVRVMTAVSDLHAADAQYHKDCMASFRTNICASGSKSYDVESAFEHVVDAMLIDKSRIWNALEIEELYISHGGTSLIRKHLIKKLSEHFHSDLLILSAPGIANILAFRSTAGKLMRVVENDTGCDTVSYLFGIGKTTVIKVLKSKRTLTKLGVTEELMSNIAYEATKFIAACYGFPNEEDMTSLRYVVWSNKMSNNKLNSAPHLKVLPPTTEAFEMHVNRSHLQAAIWRCALNPDPPELNPAQYGWMYDSPNQCFSPVAIPPGVSPAPVEVLKLIKCGCSSSHPCTTSRCSCSSAQLSCSIFCACSGGDECRNQRTTDLMSKDDDSDDDSEVTPECWDL